MLVSYQIQPTQVVQDPNPPQNTSQQPLCFALTGMQHLLMHHGAIATSSESSTSLHKIHNLTSLSPFINAQGLSPIPTKPTMTTAIEYCEWQNVGNRLNVIIRIMILLITSTRLSFVSLYHQPATQIGQSLVFNYP
jgi:hypothetical protein